MKLDFKYLVIIGLVIIIFLMRACNGDVIVPNEPIVITKYDTIWKETHDTIIKKIRYTDIKYVPINDVPPPTDNIDTCKARFQRLYKELATQTTYKDTIKLDSIGTIVVIDTVWRNKLKNRIYIENYKIPLVTKTITIIKQPDPKRQLYIGGNLFGDKRTLQYISPGLLYKDRKDRIFQANIGVNVDGGIIYGLGTYWKINLNKK